RAVVRPAQETRPAARSRPRQGLSGHQSQHQSCLYLRGAAGRGGRLQAGALERPEGARGRDPHHQHHRQCEHWSRHPVQRQGSERQAQECRDSEPRRQAPHDRAKDRVERQARIADEPVRPARLRCSLADPAPAAAAGRSVAVGAFNARLRGLWDGRGTPLGQDRSVAAEIYFNVAVSGVLTGLVYGLMAVGLSVIFGVIRVVNFAHGEMTTIAMYLALVLFNAFGLDPLAMMLPIAGVLFAFGYALQSGLINPFINRPEHSQFILLVALALVIVNVLLIGFGPDARNVQTSYAFDSFMIGPLIVDATKVYAGATTV